MARPTLRAWALMTVAAAAIAGPAWAAPKQFDIPRQDLAGALEAFGRQGDTEIIFRRDQTRGRLSPALSGSYEPEVALRMLLSQSGLMLRRVNDNTFTVAPAGEAAPDPQSQGADTGASATAVDELIVTAQKKQERIQDVPIAISAFSQDQLTTAQIAGGPDLMTQIPNVTFTKTNFTSYSIAIRGIGTQAISATVDPAVAVAFNNTPFIRNRFFEQEFFDVQRVEVLRGPQGTLYGRNATAGVVNLLSARPVFDIESRASVDFANYGSHRLEGMLNLPLVEDKIALRLAGAWTKRDGFATNELTGDQIDGRDLWSGRLSLAFEPTDRFKAVFIYEHFQEDDDRLRSGKQLCKKDPSPTVINGLPVPQEGGNVYAITAYLSQGCLPASLYANDSFQTPNGFALPYYGPTANLSNPVFPELDPYLNSTQSRDLRVIESTLTPQYRAKTDIAQLQMSFDLTDNLTLASETAYSTDELYSFQDYNRFTTTPGAFNPAGSVLRPDLVSPDGVFCDPQLGCSDRLLLGDLSTAKSRQFSQEFRLSSDYGGPFNFSLGANFLRYDTEDKYYVFVNSLTMFSGRFWGAENTPWVPGVSDNTECLSEGFRPGNPSEVSGITPCVYIDPNPIGKLNDKGHNYFLSKNPYRLISYAAFGEAYYNITPDLKLTAGLRWTVDRKQAPQVPSWLLAADSVGYPVAGVVKQEWSEPTGRLTLDWKPHLAFTDETLLYASYAHGYKAGGANPPPPVIATYGEFDEATVGEMLSHPKTFDAEYIDAFEIGAKNTLLDGKLTLNLTGFYYDYRGYQISQIVNRSAINLNFDAKVWGAELEADWRPVENLKFGLKGGYQQTRLADGSQAIDLMDRTAGDPRYVIVKPFPTVPSNCIMPADYVTFADRFNIRPGYYNVSANGACVDAYYAGLDPGTGLPYVPNPTQGWSGPLDQSLWAGYPGFDPSSVPNNGEGIAKDLSGNELPNAPHFTGTFTADYTIPLSGDWLLTLHGDFYYQSEAWTRVFNTEGYDKLKAYTNLNLAVFLNNDPSGLRVMAYVKNVFDRDSITGAFLNSDDTGLTTNVFLTEPRLFGIRVSKEWGGGGPSWLGGFGEWRQREPGERWPLEVELSGGLARMDADNTVFAPDFLSTFSGPVAPPLSPQSQDLDWGDSRGLKLTYALKDSPWSVALDARRIETNGQDDALRQHQVPGGFVLDASLPDLVVEGAYNYISVSAADGETLTAADFTAGRDFEVGFLPGATSTLSVGVRYAKLESRSSVAIIGEPDNYVPPELALFLPSTNHEYEGSLTTERGFEGVGPAVSWAVSQPLLKGDDWGQVNLDWAVGGAVLFGDQDMSQHDERRGAYHVGPDTTVLFDTATDRSRSKSTSVPVLALDLGLSYSVQRVKVSAGYRMERYFDVIDGGIEARRTYERTIDGPYFKIAIGFGG
jgi:iron complex outermembrane receptor protein